MMQTIDPYSYQCGVIDSLNELVSAGVKRLALSRPLSTQAERDALIAFAHDSCKRHGTKLYPEDTPFVTDLFPLSAVQGRFFLLFYRADHIIEEYIRLKERKASLLDNRAYFGGNRTQLALSFGRLLSYGDEAIRHLLEINQEKEQV